MTCLSNERGTGSSHGYELSHITRCVLVWVPWGATGPGQCEYALGMRPCVLLSPSPIPPPPLSPSLSLPLSIWLCCLFSWVLIMYAHLRASLDQLVPLVHVPPKLPCAACESVLLHAMYVWHILHKY